MNIYFDNFFFGTRIRVTFIKDHLVVSLVRGENKSVSVFNLN